MNVVVGWRQGTLDKCSGTCFPYLTVEKQQSDHRAEQKFNSALSAAGVTLLHIAGNILQKAYNMTILKVHLIMFVSIVY